MDGSDDATTPHTQQLARQRAESTNDVISNGQERLGLGFGLGFRRRRDPLSGGDVSKVSLRQWLDRPRRAVEAVECLHVFRQIAAAVSAAHGVGVVVGNVRPSCFVVSLPLNRVAFIESASCSEDSGERDDRLGSEIRDRVLGAENEEATTATSPSVFPLKEVLRMESKWYTSPEEGNGGSGGGSGAFASDVYQLGVLLFELFCAFDSAEERTRNMANLRHRVLPPQLLLKWPKEASFCLWLLHPRPDSRPKINDVLKSELIDLTRDSMEEREAAIGLSEDIEDSELLLEFLLHLQKQKREIADKLHDSIVFLSADIEDIANQQANLQGKSSSEADRDDHLSYRKFLLPLFSPSEYDGSYYSSSRKRFKSKRESDVDGERPKLLADSPILETDQLKQENFLLKSSRLMDNLKKLEMVYFTTRSRQMKSAGHHGNKPVQGSSNCNIRPEGSSVDGLVSKEGRNRNNWDGPFLDGLCKYMSFSKLKVKADLKQTDLLNSLNLVCSLGFDRDQEFFATAGVNKKIKIFECDNILNEDHDIHYPVVEMTNKSKISCISWNSYIKSQLASSDFDCLVQVWDVTRCQVLTEMKEHEKRVWSVDFSLSDPTKLASGSDDGTVKLWNINQAGSIGTIYTKGNVCCVQFQPDSGHFLAIGSADHRVYCYDLRNISIPFCNLVGHMKTVSYVRYLDSSSIVSASTDNSLKLWDMPSRPLRVIRNPLQTFTGHTNIKNFVGLSISDGYIATGSETNEVFVYYKAFPMPVLSYKFSITDPISGQEIDDTSQFISSVCWRGQSSILLAANSTGNIRLLEMV